MFRPWVVPGKVRAMALCLSSMRRGGTGSTRRDISPASMLQGRGERFPALHPAAFNRRVRLDGPRALRPAGGLRLHAAALQAGMGGLRGSERPRST